MKFTPKLHFISDTSYDSALAMDQLLNSARQRDRERNGPDEDDPIEL